MLGVRAVDPSFAVARDRGHRELGPTGVAIHVDHDDGDREHDYHGDHRRDPNSCKSGSGSKWKHDHLYPAAVNQQLGVFVVTDSKATRRLPL